MPRLTARGKRAPLHLTIDVSGQDAGGSPFAHRARTLNISGGGLCFESPRRLLAGSRLTLHIQIPPPLRRHFAGRALYRVKAVVCRIEHLEGAELSRIGARFLEELEA
jgi:hypothetical protein